ncbi:MAG TPA: NAD(P)-dependent oxidoreductase [Gemmatimonadales bacterium]
MTRPRVLVAEAAGFSPAAVALLESAADVELADLDRPGLLRATRDADVLWVRLRHRIDSEVMGAGQRLRAIVTPTTGLNHIDLAEAARRDVRVLSLRGEAEFLRDVRATAEHTIGLLLALLRRLPAALEHVRAGGWDRDRFKGGEIHGSMAGVVGYGRLGRRVAQYLGAFGAEVLANDVDASVEPEGAVRMVPLGELLERSDFVLLHASHSAASHRFFGREQFAAMKPGALFVNTARGELVDEGALLEALEQGRLGGAALDVLADERSGGMGWHPLVALARRRPELIITPHIGGCTAPSMERTEAFLARRLHAELMAGTLEPVAR